MMIEGGARARLLQRIRRRPDGRGPRLVVAVTGGIGSGKSTVTRGLARAGAVVADADAIAREVVEPGTEGLAAVVERFGDSVLDARGGLDRGRLADLVFSEAGARADLDAILHPLIAERAWTILDAAPEGSLAVYDIPLLVETDSAALFDAVIVVDAPDDARIERLAARGVDRADARRRIGAQADRDQRLAIASIWIDNEGSIADLDALTGRIIASWLV
ncbi:dephospho-CoA kinase [Actinomyces sp. B33]|uniref:dephospho-CoA kinase n=1 Tax=Actinomyces sp. B33 TaxID=2942131 RepID=UPI002FEF522A